MNIEYLLSDFILGFLLFFFIYFLIKFASLKINKKYGLYISRKTTPRILSGILVIFAPVIFHYPYAFSFYSLILGLVYLRRHLKKTLDKNLQIEKEYGEVYFCFNFFAIPLIFWNLDIAIMQSSLLFLSFGDGITGIIRNKVLKERAKDIYGFLGMLLLCLPIGFYYKGILGLMGAFFASFFESLEIFVSLKTKNKPILDDNILIAFGSAAIMYSFSCIL